MFSSTEVKINAGAIFRIPTAMIAPNTYLHSGLRELTLLFLKRQPARQ